MYKFNIIEDANGKPCAIETSLMGTDLLNTSKLNKGCAFSAEERSLFNLSGLLPYQIETLEQQSARMYLQFQEHRSNLGKNIYLNVLHDYNETLFYRLVSEHLEEMLPIIYTPTVGDAVQRFSLEHRKAKGLYIAYNDRNKIEHLLEEHAPPQVNLTVVTDGEAVLGIGDQGIGGINISIAKLMVYTLCGGLHPHRFLPIQLDVGTNNVELLNDPMYLGWRHERITGQAYDDFIDAFVNAIIKKYPHVFLHWEDLGRDKAQDILHHYRKKICTFNGDSQGTGVVALACLLAGIQASGIPLTDHRIVILGAGTAGVGIADQIVEAFKRTGMKEKDIYAQFWLLDKSGLLMTESDLLSFQKPYAKEKKDIANWTLRQPNKIDLYDVIKNTGPTILIGCSTATGAFTEEIVKEMTKKTARPLIMPLSNPTILSEAMPEDLLHWTDGKAIIATGSPFPNVMYKEKMYRIAQSNNALAFPGIGLGCITAKAKHVSDDMLWAAAKALSECSPVYQDKMAPLLPKLAEAKHISKQVAFAVATQACAEGLADVSDKIDLMKSIEKNMWEPQYYPYQKMK